MGTSFEHYAFLGNYRVQHLLSDEYNISIYCKLFPGKGCESACYRSAPVWKIDWEEVKDPKTGINLERLIPHVCDFVVEYINSDVLVCCYIAEYSLHY